MTRAERAARFDAEELAGARATADAMDLEIRWIPAWLADRLPAPIDQDEAA